MAGNKRLRSQRLGNGPRRYLSEQHFGRQVDRARKQAANTSECQAKNKPRTGNNNAQTGGGWGPARECTGRTRTMFGRGGSSCLCPPQPCTRVCGPATTCRTTSSAEDKMQCQLAFMGSDLWRVQRKRTPSCTRGCTGDGGRGPYNLLREERWAMC